MKIRASNPTQFAFQPTDSPDTRAQKLEIIRKSLLGVTGVGVGSLTYVNGVPSGPTIWSPGYWNVNIDKALVFTASNGNFIEWESDASGTGHPRSMWSGTPGWGQFWGIGYQTTHGRYGLDGETAWEFAQTPYVGANVVYHAGNLPANVASFNTRTGAVTLTSGDVIAALTYTPQPAGAYLTANQNIVLSGDVTGSGTTAIAVTIGAHKVTRGMLAAAAGATILGATAAGDIGDLTAAQAKTFLAISTADVSGLGTVATLASDVDTALAANSDTRVPTQKAVKAYIDAAVVGLLDFKGSIACAANPNYPVGVAGDAYYVSTAGKIGGASGKSVDIGDVVVAEADNAGGTEASVGASWFVLEHNLTGALVAANNLSDLASAATARTNLGLAAIAASGSGADLADGTVTLAKQANMATASVVYRKTAGAGAPEVQTLATLKTDLNLSGTNSGDQTITLTGDATGSGTGSFAVTVTARSKRTVFNASGTWTKDSRSKIVKVRAWGAGGSGGSGGSIASGTASSGGGGGGGGAMVDFTFDAATLGSTETVTIGAGGTLVAGTTAAAGNNGNAGGNTTFGTWVTAFGGGRGGGGQSAALSGGGGGAGIGGAGGNATGSTVGSAGAGGGVAGTGSGTAPANLVAGGGSGGTGCASGAAGSAGSSSAASVWGAAGGGGGGGLATTPANTTGGAGGRALPNPGAVGSGASAGGSGGGGGSQVDYMPGQGGGGGGGSAAGTGGAGGAGQTPGGGGGGGGASISTQTSGASGAGGGGLVIVEEFF